jgi:hypothetical protein
VIVAYTVNGEHMLLVAYPDVADREIVFVSDLDDYLNNPVDPDRPAQELACNLSADSVGGFIGIVLSLP